MSQAEDRLPQPRVSLSPRLVGKDPDKEPFLDREIPDAFSANDPSQDTGQRLKQMQEAARESAQAMKQDQCGVVALIERLGVELGGDPMGPAPPELLDEIFAASKKAVASRLAWTDQLAALGESCEIEDALGSIGAESEKARRSRL